MLRARSRGLIRCSCRRVRPSKSLAKPSQHQSPQDAVLQRHEHHWMRDSELFQVQWSFNIWTNIFGDRLIGLSPVITYSLEMATYSFCSTCSRYYSTPCRCKRDVPCDIYITEYRLTQSVAMPSSQKDGSDGMISNLAISVTKSNSRIFLWCYLKNIVDQKCQWTQYLRKCISATCNITPLILLHLVFEKLRRRRAKGMWPSWLWLLIIYHKYRSDNIPVRVTHVFELFFYPPHSRIVLLYFSSISVHCFECNTIINPQENVKFHVKCSRIKCSQRKCF